MELREVLITVSNQEVPNITYLAKSYPNRDYNNNGLIELYKVPIYYTYIEGTNDKNNSVKKTWQALRFMPYWNPKGSKTGYKTEGWINAGIHYFPKSTVKEYKPNYTIHNSVGISSGAIVIKDSFYIHEGPEDVNAFGAGSAGCIEIIGFFDRFKDDIMDLSGCNLSADTAILRLVAKRKLFLQIESATPPDIFNSLWKEYDPINKKIV